MYLANQTSLYGLSDQMLHEYPGIVYLEEYWTQLAKMYLILTPLCA